MEQLLIWRRRFHEIIVLSTCWLYFCMIRPHGLSQNTRKHRSSKYLEHFFHDG